MRPKGTTTLFAAAALSCALGGGVWAEEPSRDDDKPSDETRLEELEVRAQRPLSAASSREMNARDFAIRPHSTLIQILNNVPGLVVAQHQGGGKAPQWFLRGFDADHGTDFAVFVDDMPVNLVTHAHGQGYADPNFVIPETIDRVQLFKGPYFPQFGDFATAGALKLITKESSRRTSPSPRAARSTRSATSSARRRSSATVKTLFAAQAYYTNGPFNNPENLARYNGLARFTLDPDARIEAHRRPCRATPPTGTARGRSRAPQVSSGALDRFGSIDPTEGGHTDRENLLLDWTLHADRRGHLGGPRATAQRYKLRLWSDFTFFPNTGLRFVAVPERRHRRHRRRAGAPGRALHPRRRHRAGRLALGCTAARARYTRNWFLARVSACRRSSRSRPATTTSTSRCSAQVRRTSFFTVNDVYVREHSFSGYWAQQIFFTDWLRFEGGLRGDFFIFDVANRLPRQGPDPNFTRVFLNGHTTDGPGEPEGQPGHHPASRTPTST